jgi:hypothetical protein
MIKGGKVRLEHRGSPLDVPVIECFQAEGDTPKAGIILKNGDWWVSLWLGATPETRAIFERVQAGDLQGLSIGGHGESEPVEKGDDHHGWGPE